MKRIITIFTAFIACLTIITASNTPINSIPTLNKAVKNAQPGDTIRLANGIYTDVSLVLHGMGEAGRTIVVMAETPGQVFIEGHSRMRIGGQYLEVHGLVFRNGHHANVWEFRSQTGMYANHCRISNCALLAYNDRDDRTKSRWVLLYGKHNRVDHCTFTGKENEGVLMAVVLEESKQDEASRRACMENQHRIDHNYFGVRPLLKYVDNGGEIIRIGDSHTSLLSSQTIVEENVFEHCDGEVEIISVKSCDNTLRRNLFKESAGALVLRHGNRNRVEENVFIGNGKKNAAGIRVINAGHIIRNNYLEGLRGKGSYSAFSIMNALETPKANEYHQVKDVLIEGNILVDCQNISFNLRHGDPARAAAQTKVPKDVIFQSNLFFHTKEPIRFNFLDGQKGIKEILFKENTLNNKDKGDKLPKGFDIERNMKKPERPILEFEHGMRYE